MARAKAEYVVQALVCNESDDDRVLWADLPATAGNDRNDAERKLRAAIANADNNLDMDLEFQTVAVVRPRFRANKEDRTPKVTLVFGATTPEEE